MNFDMVALNYPIVPLTDPIIDPLTGDIFEPTKYDWSISIAGASQENMERMIEWVGTTIEDDLEYKPTEGNPIYWQIAESCSAHLITARFSKQDIQLSTSSVLVATSHSGRNGTRLLTLLSS